jgi:hypothetical protein
LETVAFDVTTVSLYNEVNNFKIRRSGARVVLFVNTPTTVSNDSGERESSSGVMAAEDARHVALVLTALAAVTLSICSPIHSKLGPLAVSS